MNGKQLKNSILQWAIQGKLVPQDASEEPAVELLKRINPNFTPPEYEGELPQGWVAVKIDDVCSFQNGYAFESQDYKSSGTPIIRISDIVNNSVELTKCVYYQGEVDEKFRVSKGDLLIALSGATTGKMGIFNSSDKAYLNQRVGNLKIKYVQILSNEYRNLFMQSKVNEILALAYGGAQPNISGKTICDFILPLPPFAEQKRIVEKIEELMPLVERYTKAQEGLDKLNAGIKVKLRASILQEAIQGHLVPQDASEEPAIESLKRINPKFTPLEYEGELPEGWSVTTMSMLCSLNDGEKIQDKAMVNLDAKYLRGKSEGTILKSGRYIPANSLVILVDGENSGEVFRTPIEGYQGSTFKRLTIDENMDEDFVLWVINSHRVKLREHKVGSAIPHLNKKLFRETLVLVPPLAEQHRIVERLESLFSTLDTIETNLN